MSTLEEHRSTGADEAGADAAVGPHPRLAVLGSTFRAFSRWQAALPVPARWRAGLVGIQRLLRRHRLFAAALGLAVVLRVIVMAGFTPAALFKLDTYDYLWGAAHLAPNPVNPSGYSLFLWLLRPFRSLILIAALQHLMGLGIAVMIYAVLRRRGVSGWLSALAAAPVLFDPAQLLIEQLIMADILAMFLMIAAFAILLVRKSPSVWRSASAALLMGTSAIVRPNTLPVIVAIAVYLLVIRAGWRTACAALAAGLLPVAGYVAWFTAATGNVGLTNSEGLFLWSRTMSFANCAVIKPPPDLAALCLGRQPSAQVRPTATYRLLPRQYLWDHRAWLWKDVGPGLVPDAAGFTPANNARARDFAIRAIEAQPLAYLRVIGAGLMRTFIHSNQMHFPGTQPLPVIVSPANLSYMLAAVRDYLGTTDGLAPYVSNRTGTRLQQPYATMLVRYQDLIHLPGPLLGLIVLTGLAGLFIPRRRTAAGALIWISAAMIIILPAAEHEYTFRYVIPAIPLACLAAGLALRNRDKDALASGYGQLETRPPERPSGVAGTTDLAELPHPADTVADPAPSLGDESRAAPGQGDESRTAPGLGGEPRAVPGHGDESRARARPG